MAKVFFFIDLALGAVAYKFNDKIKDPGLRAIVLLGLLECIIFSIVNLAIWIFVE